MLELNGVSSGYGPAQVLFGLDLRLERGEILALLGRNGAGKSTALKTIMGLLRASAGSVRFEDHSIERLAPHEIARLGLGYVPEERRIFTGLTVMENLEAGRQPARTDTPTWTPAKLFELFPNLGRMRERRGGNMSGGEQQMLAIARTLMGNPKTILLDEPFEGLAPLIVEGLSASIRALKQEGLTVLLCEQNPRFVEKLADRTLRIERGRIA
jgi:branched-chain amino acid transport system ATP-binding protein